MVMEITMKEEQYNSNHLILVPCHSIWDPTYRSNDEIGNYGQNQEAWDLADFQKEGHDHIAFIKHGLKAVQLTLGLIVENNDFNENGKLTNPLLLFSGSQTCKITRESEAQSYCCVLNHILSNSEDGSLKAFKGDKDIEELITDIHLSSKKLNIPLNKIMEQPFISTEEYALDSFQNVLYSIYRFKEYTDNFPDTLTIVGFAFKKKRFLDYHLKAIDFPIDKVTYFSYEPNPKYEIYLQNGCNLNETEIDSTYTGYYEALDNAENKNAISLFANDWYGIRGKLHSKRDSRNHHKRYPGYESLNMIVFNNNIPDENFFEMYIHGKMPWSTNT